MKVHPIFSKNYSLWWFILATIVGLKVMTFGLREGGISEMETYKDSGVVFWIVGILFNALFFATPVYLIYRLISKKWNNKVYMILISVFVGLGLIFI